MTVVNLVDIKDGNKRESLFLFLLETSPEASNFFVRRPRHHQQATRRILDHNHAEVLDN